MERGTEALANTLSDVAPSETLPGGNPTYHVPLYGRRDTDRLDPTLRSNVTVAEGLSVEFLGQLFGA